MKPISRCSASVSPKPRVVIRPVVAPVRSISALVACVVPWPKAVTRLRSYSGPSPCAFSATATASKTPFSSSPGVVGALAVEILPPSSISTRSVKVPPISIPRYMSADTIKRFPCRISYGIAAAESTSRPNAATALE